ncbi:MAG: HNH endonuclease [Chloroflexota bacterium]|nr:HNH endonuclease [Chloroflexota bacterium]MDE2683117.1 HNH endonuclease [Chloroflexota bacterium]
MRPRADGGSDAYDNLTLLCPPCNREKRDRITLTGLQDLNRRSGHLQPENEPNIRHGRAQGRTRRRRR